MVIYECGGDFVKPENKIRQVGVRLDSRTIQRIQRVAESERRTVSNYVRGLILDDLKRRESEETNKGAE